MAAPIVALGNLVEDNAYVFRAFALDGNRRKGKIRARAFYRPSDHADGLSVGVSPEACVAELTTNYGYCRLQVGKIHGLAHGLEVRLDPQREGHALIHNLPCIDSGDENERKKAELIAGKLARCAELVTDEPYYPTPEGPQPHPQLP